MHIEGWPPPGSFGCFPVLAANEYAFWSGRHLKTGQVRLTKAGQVADHLTAADYYQLVALALDADLIQQELPVLGGFDPGKRLDGKEVVTTNLAYCRALLSHLVGFLEMAQARPDRLAQYRRWMEQECCRHFAGLLARPNDDRTACQPSNRARVNGFGGNHRRVQRSSANWQRSSRPQHFPP
jgi:hypothetical protein